MFFKRKSVYDMIVAGLGNPGQMYENTRHNVGFRVLDILAEQHNCKIIKQKNKALFGEATLKDNRVLLLKPQTFMNLSGEAITLFAKYYNIPPEKILIIFDDISLPTGKLRIRLSGSDGGHNGLKSVQLYLGQNYPRIKIGVGEKPHPDYDLSKWVLSKFSESDEKILKPSIKLAAEAAEKMVTHGYDEAIKLIANQ